jgi:hypothetical protein
MDTIYASPHHFYWHMKGSNNTISMKQKPTLLSIRQHTNVTTEQLAREAGVTLTEAYAVEIGAFVQEDIASKVLMAFSHLTGKTLALTDIRINNNVPEKPYGSSIQ